MFHLNTDVVGGVGDLRRGGLFGFTTAYFAERQRFTSVHFNQSSTRERAGKPQPHAGTGNIQNTHVQGSVQPFGSDGIQKPQFGWPEEGNPLLFPLFFTVLFPVFHANAYRRERSRS